MVRMGISAWVGALSTEKLINGNGLIGMRLRAIISYLIIAALMTTGSKSVGAILYQACPPQCCSPTVDYPACSMYGGQLVSGIEISKSGHFGQKAADNCNCNSTCDDACSQCAYFQTGAIQPMITWTPALSRFTLRPSETPLRDYAWQIFRPPPRHLT